MTWEGVVFIIIVCIIIICHIVISIQEIIENFSIIKTINMEINSDFYDQVLEKLDQIKKLKREIANTIYFSTGLPGLHKIHMLEALDVLSTNMMHTDVPKKLLTEFVENVLASVKDDRDKIEQCMKDVVDAFNEVTSEENTLVSGCDIYFDVCIKIFESYKNIVKTISPRDKMHIEKCREIFFDKILDFVYTTNSIKFRHYSI